MMVREKGWMGRMGIPKGEGERRVCAMGLGGGFGLAGVGAGIGVFWWWVSSSGNWNGTENVVFLAGTVLAFLVGTAAKVFARGGSGTEWRLRRIAVDAATGGGMAVVLCGFGTVLGVMAMTTHWAGAAGATKIAEQAAWIALAVLIVLAVMIALCGLMTVIAWRRRQEES